MDIALNKNEHDAGEDVVFVEDSAVEGQLGLASGLMLSGAMESAGAAESVGTGATVGALLPDGVLVHAPTRTAAPRMKMAMRDFKT